MKKINVIILICALKVGGAEKHIHDLVLNLDRKKFNFIIICLYELGAIGKDLAEHGIKVYHNVMRNKLDIFGGLKLNRIIRDEKADILFIVHTPPTLFWGILCAKISKIKATLTRSPTTNPVAHVKRNKIVNFFILRFVDKIVAQSNFHKEYQVKHGVFPDKIVVINNGVDLEHFSSSPTEILSLRREIGLHEGRHVIGIIARLSPEKGHKVFLKAAKKIIDSLPQTHFLVAGDGGERKDLENMCKDLLIEQKVHFLGMINNVSRVVQLFDVGVLSTGRTGETFPNAVLEYMAASKPVVATESVRNSEIVIDEKTGYIVPYNDPGALADAVIKLLKDKKLAKKMGEAGFKRVKEKFIFQSMLNKYEILFISLLK